jgi:hypothetical protein
MTVVTLRDVAPNYGRCFAFFRVAVKVGLLRAVNTNPVTVIEDELEAFVRGLDATQVEQVNRVLHKARYTKTTPPLAGRRKPGSKPGSGFVSQLRRGEETTTTGAGGTSSGNAGQEARGQKKNPSANGLSGGRE